jgi:hypothetical protein
VGLESLSGLEGGVVFFLGGGCSCSGVGVGVHFAASCFSWSGLGVATITMVFTFSFCDSEAGCVLAKSKNTYIFDLSSTGAESDPSSRGGDHTGMWWVLAPLTVRQEGMAARNLSRIINPPPREN